MSEETTRNSGEVPIILPTPVAIHHVQESKFTVMSRFLSWLTGFMLSCSVLVSLVSVTNERNDLSNQLTCRANANFQASKASYEKQVALADHSVLVGKVITISIETPVDDPNRPLLLQDLAEQIKDADAKLEEASTALREAIGQQQAALTNC